MSECELTKIVSFVSTIFVYSSKWPFYDNVIHNSTNMWHWNLIHIVACFYDMSRVLATSRVGDKAPVSATSHVACRKKLNNWTVFSTCRRKRRRVSAVSALEVVLHDYALYKSTFTLLYFVDGLSSVMATSRTFLIICSLDEMAFRQFVSLHTSNGATCHGRRAHPICLN